MNLAGSKVFVFHPSFGYFLDEFGITQEAVETGGKEPTAQTLARLIDEAKQDKPSAIFVQAQFPVSAAKKIADSVGAKVVPLDPLAPDWLDNLKRIGDALEKNAKMTDHHDTDVVLRFSRVSFSYDTVPVLEGADFHVHKGEFVALVGQNGAGKNDRAQADTWA